jgi:hypothetical protein
LIWIETTEIECNNRNSYNITTIEKVNNFAHSQWRRWWPPLGLDCTAHR